MSNIDSNIKGKILVVEDEPSIRRVLSETLVSRGFEVNTVTNGLEAKARLTDNKDYGLLIIDIKMPVMNGIELYKYISEQNPKLANRVIFISGDILGRDTELFLEETRRPFLAKPFNSGELIKLVEETLRSLEK